ncbi:hypothetical protein MYMA111404_01230 [Mycoplasma marinum]|uniref:TNase-like domain-containing protein n=1 Tax=Mycoplasma marinum TaxID=1937190 RepID=A0A4R0XR20_9MOLU|nr:hypothetical protein [Mycoplasma marinum]TCG12050.1 hypothetical protein C4B24_00395 [Mycoplasma marinum]
MNKKIKITLGTAAISLAAIAPAAFVVSCGSENKDSKPTFESRNNTFEKALQTLKSSYSIEPYKVKIVNWHDGDTPKVKFLDKKIWGRPGVDIKTGIAKIRIASIDTPEIGTGGYGGKPYAPTTGDEYKYAKAGKDLADKIMPVGTTVSVFTSFSQTYDRIAGSIFFDSDNNGSFESSWAVTIMNKGLTLPFVSSPNDVIDENNILHYIGIPFADAFNYAYNNKIGMFSKNIEEISKIHGSTDFSSVKWHSADNDSAPRNVYDYYKAWEEINAE